MGQKLGLFDKVTVGTIVGAGIVEAAQQALKDAEQVRAAMPMLDLSGGWNYVPLALLVIGGASWVAKQFISQDSPKARRPLSPPSFPVEAGDRVFLAEDMTKARMESLTKGMTSSQAERVLSAYVGKWMRFEGLVHDIKAADDQSMMIFFAKDNLERGYDYSAFSPIFDRKTWEDRLSTIHKGDRVRGIGRIEQSFGGALGLRQCELI